MIVDAERPGRIDFLIKPEAFVEGEDQIVGGEIDDFPNVKLEREEIRFNIAEQTGRPPEAVYLPHYDGLPLPLDTKAAYWAGQTSLAFLADRWHLPPHPSAGPEPPILH